MDDEAETYRLWRVRKTVMQVCFIRMKCYLVGLINGWCCPRKKFGDRKFTLTSTNFRDRLGSRGALALVPHPPYFGYYANYDSSKYSFGFLTLTLNYMHSLNVNLLLMFPKKFGDGRKLAL